MSLCFTVAVPDEGAGRSGSWYQVLIRTWCCRKASPDAELNELAHEGIASTQSRETKPIRGRRIQSELRGGRSLHVAHVRCQRCGCRRPGPA